MYPSLEQAKAAAASGAYRRIPVCRELLADRFTTIEVMRTLRDGPVPIKRKNAAASLGTLRNGPPGEIEECGETAYLFHPARLWR